jgi:hypothetical protein
VPKTTPQPVTGPVHRPATGKEALIQDCNRGTHGENRSIAGLSPKYRLLRQD